MFDVTLEGEADVIRQWGQAYGALKNSMRYAVSKGTREGAREARAKHTFKNQTGDLEKSIDGFIVGWTESGLKITGVIRAAAKHASFVEYDTKPHEIVGNPFLTFVWKGVPVSFRYVQHPGTKGQPFMHLAYYKAERVIIRELEIGIERMQEALNR